ncbi:MAG: hypothetical protein NTX45_23415 [Proteobacteria bacterium]|nr:hypothetical protein [Pseudomonadota bacterium]
MAENNANKAKAPAFSYRAHYELVVSGYKNAALSVPAISQGTKLQVKDLLAVGEVSADGKATEREHLEHLQAKGAIDTNQPLIVLGVRNNLVNLRCPVVLDGQTHAVEGEDPLRSLRPYYGLGFKDHRFVCDAVNGEGFMAVGRNKPVLSVSVHSPLPFPGNAAILAAISAGETPALPGGGERLLLSEVERPAPAGVSGKLTGPVELGRHSGMDRRNPDCMDASKPRHPWSLGSGDPCRNDAESLNSTAKFAPSDFFCAGIPVLWDCIEGDDLLDLILCEAADHSHVFDLPRGNNPAATDATRYAWQSLQTVFIEQLYSGLPVAATALRRVLDSFNPPLRRCDDYFHAVYGVREDGALVCLFAQGRLEELGQIMKQRGCSRAVCLENSGSIMPSFLPKGLEGDSIPLVRAPNFRERGRAVITITLVHTGFASLTST